MVLSWYEKSSIHRRYASFLTSCHYCVSAILKKTYLHICNAYKKKNVFPKKKKKKEHRKQNQLSKTKNLSMSYKEEVSKCLNCHII